MQVFNFNAGPACLPKPVMLKAQEEFVNYLGCGYGIEQNLAYNTVYECGTLVYRTVLG